jgi:hypothetical protein
MVTDGTRLKDRARRGPHEPGPRSPPATAPLTKDTEREVAAVGQEEAGELPRPAAHPGAGDDASVVSEICLFGQLVRRGVPACGDELRLNQRSAGVGFVHGDGPAAR